MSQRNILDSAQHCFKLLLNQLVGVGNGTLLLLSGLPRWPGCSRRDLGSHATEAEGGNH